MVQLVDVVIDVAVRLRLDVDLDRPRVEHGRHGGDARALLQVLPGQAFRKLQGHGPVSSVQRHGPMSRAAILGDVPLLALLRQPHRQVACRREGHLVVMFAVKVTLRGH